MPDADYDDADLSLADILALPDDDAPPPADAADGDEPADDDDSAEGPLSPEERVAEAVRQDAEDAGEDLDDDEDDDDEAPDELSVLRERAQLVDQWESWYQAERINGTIRHLKAQTDAQIAHAEAHYAGERDRIMSAIWRDAQNAPDPDQYYRTHVNAALSGWQQSRDSWISNLYAQANQQSQVLYAEANRGRYVDHLIAQFDLPDAPQVRAKLMAVSDLRRMPERAAELKEMHRQFQYVYATANQKVRETEARRVKSQQVASAATGKPRRKKPIQFEGSAKELDAILALPD